MSFNSMFFKQLASSIIGFVFLLSWYFLYKISCIFLVMPIFVGIVIFIANYQFASTKKICFANCYLKKDSWIYNLLTRKFFIFIVSLFNGVFLSTILMLNIVAFNMYDFFLLFADMILITLLYNRFSQIKFLADGIKEPAIKNVIAGLNSIILAILFVIIGLYQTPPEYIQNDLMETVHLASREVYSSCEVLDSLVRWINELVATKFWIILKLLLNTQNFYLKIILLGAYLFGNYLMMFAFSRYILEILSLLKKGLQK